MSNVLITGGSHAEIPLIHSLHELGYTVISTGLNRDGLGHKHADTYAPADFSDKDEMLRMAKKYGISGIVSGCNDFAYLSAAYVAEQLGLKGYDAMSVAMLIHHKDEFRALQKACGIHYPKFIVCEKKDDLALVKDSLELPVVVKPVDLTGGKGVEICYTWDAVEEQFSETCRLTRESRIIIEEYIVGENHGTSMLLKDGKAAFAFFDNEEYFKNKYLVSGAYSPSDLSDSQKEDVICQVETMAQRAKLCDGLFHCQFIIDEMGRPFLIDPCRRAPGDLYITLVSYATGIDYPMAIVKSQLGLSFDEELTCLREERCIARECMMAEANGFIRDIIIDPDYESHIIDKMQWLHPGDRIENYLTYKAGIVFFEYPDAESLKEHMKTLYDHMRIDILA